MPASSKHDVFEAISDPTRRRILELLAEKEMSITTIAGYFSISRTAVNKHLRILSGASLISSRKIGREIRYKLQVEALAELKTWLKFFDHYWDEKLIALKTYVEKLD